jgi:hypothetical protein
MLQIGDKPLILYFEYGILGHNGPPMLHQLRIGATAEYHIRALDQDLSLLVDRTWLSFSPTTMTAFSEECRTCLP